MYQTCSIIGRLRSLAMQEYDFKIIYHKGSSNGNADALLRHPTEMCAITIGLPCYPLAELCAGQSNNDTISAVLQARLNSNNVPQAAKWNKPPFCQYKQIWHQLKVVDGVLCCVGIHPVLYTKKLLYPFHHQIFTRMPLAIITMPQLMVI